MGGRCFIPPAPATSFIRSIMFIIIAPEREGECREEEKEIMRPTWVLHQKFRGATGVLCKKLRGILGYFTRKGWHRCFSILVRGGQAGLGQLEAKQVDRRVVRTAPIPSNPLKLSIHQIIFTVVTVSLSNVFLNRIKKAVWMDTTLSEGDMKTLVLCDQYDIVQYM